MTRRVRRTFWALVVVAVVSTGALSKALGAARGTATGLAVAGSALLVTTSALLALRILVVAGRATTGAEPRWRWQKARRKATARPHRRTRRRSEASPGAA